MIKISKSPQRHTFQKNGYEDRLAEKGETPSEAYLDLFDKVLEEHKHKFDNPESRKNNLEFDLVSTDWILEKARSSDSYAQNIYAALCNNEFIKRDMWPILKDQRWSCSWRYAGGIVADMLEKGDYIDWYMSGMGGVSDYDIDPVEWAAKTGYVPEGNITEEIENDLFKLGWLIAKEN
jgi:hypothetical protein